MSNRDLRAQKFLLPFELEKLPASLAEFSREKAQSHIDDFAAPTGFYYSSETAKFLSEKAGQAWQTEVSQLAKSELTDRTSAQQRWSALVEDFYLHNHWDLPCQTTKPRPEKSPLTNEQKIFREMFAYVWVFIQAALVMKIVVFYFGLNNSGDSDSNNMVYLVLALLFSAGSLGFFAYRKFSP